VNIYLWKGFVRVTIRAIQCWGKYGEVVERCQDACIKLKPTI